MAGRKSRKAATRNPRTIVLLEPQPARERTAMHCVAPSGPEMPTEPGDPHVPGDPPPIPSPEPTPQQPPTPETEPEIPRAAAPASTDPVIASLVPLLSPASSDPVIAALAPLLAAADLADPVGPGGLRVAADPPAPVRPGDPDPAPSPPKPEIEPPHDPKPLPTVPDPDPEIMPPREPPPAPGQPDQPPQHDPPTSPPDPHDPEPQKIIDDPPAPGAPPNIIARPHAHDTLVMSNPLAAHEPPVVHAPVGHRIDPPPGPLADLAAAVGPRLRVLTLGPSAAPLAIPHADSVPTITPHEPADYDHEPGETDDDGGEPRLREAPQMIVALIAYDHEGEPPYVPSPPPPPRSRKKPRGYLASLRTLLF